MSKPILLLLLVTLSLTVCSQSANKCNNAKIQNKPAKEVVATEKKYKVTFIELGSVKCIPCKEMQKVIKSIEAKYGTQIKIIFYDVWTKEGKPFGDVYKINGIPAQVFLDENGNEFFRHEGFFPEKELIAVLKTKSVTD
ncbi:MAG: thioredoxin family protein [Ferruginibacter sp.]